MSGNDIKNDVFTTEDCAKVTPLSITSTDNPVYESLHDMYVQVTYADKESELISINRSDALRLINRNCRPNPVGQLTAWRYGDWGVAWIDVQFMKHVSGMLGVLSMDTFV